MTEWYEADMMATLLQAKLDILYQQNQILEELDLQNLVDPEILIQNLEEIDNLENKLYGYKETASVYISKYGEILPVFLGKYRDYIILKAKPDTLVFQQKIEDETQELNKEIRKISSTITRYNFHFFLPEVNLNLSYNWRENRQDWDIEQNHIFKKMTRNQDEEFPEGEVEFSLPFNVFSNAGGKLSLLKAYRMELNYRGKEMQLAWDKFAIDRMNFYYAAGFELKRKTRLKELYDRNLSLQTRKYREEPTLLGSNPELKLQKETIKASEAQVEYDIAEMKLYKEIYLINSLGVEAK
jgi:hypothetical protein